MGASPTTLFFLLLATKAFSGSKSKLVEWDEGFDAVEFFGFPIHGEFKHSETIGGGEGVKLIHQRVNLAIQRGAFVFVKILVLHWRQTASSSQP